MKFIFVVCWLQCFAFGIQEFQGGNPSIVPDAATESVATSSLEPLLATRQPDDTAATVATWNPEGGVLLTAIRNLKEREKSDVARQPSNEKQTDNDDFFKILERIFRRPPPQKDEAIIASNGTAAAGSVATENTTPTESAREMPRSAESRSGITTPDADIESQKSGEIFQDSSSMSEGSGAQSHQSVSCRRCYSDLQSCVQKCFMKHNCHDVERNMHQCPPVPSRVCNPFVPWRPRNECMEHHECRSPLMCCSDGCANSCMPGIWKLNKS